MINLPSFPGGGRDADWWEEGTRREGGGKEEREERDGREAERGNTPARPFCMLITDVGKARCRFAWEAFVALEKAGCLLKNYLQAGGEEREPRGPYRAGDCSCPGAAGWERQEGLEPWLPPTVTGWERDSSVFRGYFIHGAHRLRPWEVFVWALVPALYLPVPCSGTCVEASGGG